MEKVNRESEKMDPISSGESGNDEEKETTVSQMPQTQKNPFELAPVIICVLQHMNVTGLKNCRFISKEWNSAALLELKRRSKIVFKKVWDRDNRVVCIRNPALFNEEFSDHSSVIPFTAFGFSCGFEMGADLSSIGWKISEIDRFLQSHKNILHELHVNALNLFNDKGVKLKHFNITTFITDSLMSMPNAISTKLSVTQTCHSESTKIIIPTSSLTHVKKISLIGVCKVVLGDVKISPTELTLANVIFLRDKKYITSFCINDIFDLSKAKEVRLEFFRNCKILFDVNLSYYSEVDFDYLYLMGVKILNWRGCTWVVKRLKMRQCPFVERTKMQIKEFLFYFDKINISFLPRSIETLVLRVNDDRHIFCSQYVVLPNLKSLCLYTKANLSNSISHFVTCPLVELDLGCEGSHSLEIDFESIPKTVKKLKLSAVKVNIQEGDGALNLDKLVLENYSVTRHDDILKIFTSSHVKTKELVIVSCFGIQADQSFVWFLEFDKMCLDSQQRFYVGPFQWNLWFPFKNSHIYVQICG